MTTALQPLLEWIKRNTVVIVVVVFKFNTI